MEYSFSTVYMAIISCNILLILIAICFQSNKILVNVGYKLLAFFISFCFLRLLLPFEFPFTNNIVLPESFSFFIYCIRHPFVTIAGFEISIWTILQIIWILGIIFKSIFFVTNYRETRYQILANSLDISDSPRYRSILEQVCKERGKKNSFMILETRGILSPMITGVIEPWIMIPDHMKYTDQDLYYMFCHESTHHFHHDLLIKHCVNLITIVYWWNPMSYILMKKTNNILEMHVDDRVTYSDPHTICAYLNCLSGLMEQAITTPLPKRMLRDAVGIDVVLMHKRFAVLTEANKRKNIIVNALLTLLVIIVFSWSYLFIYEGSYTPPEITENTDMVTQENSYAILTEDGSYDIYYNENFFENTRSLEFYPSDLPIYKEKEFLNEKH